MLSAYCLKKGIQIRINHMNCLWAWMPWLLMPVGLGKAGPVRKISVANWWSSYLCFGRMSSYHAASSSLQAFLWGHRSRPACVYFSKYMLHRTAWLAGSVSAMERACVFVCWILWSSLVKRCQVIAHAITLHCSICSQVALSQYHSIKQKSQSSVWDTPSKQRRYVQYSVGMCCRILGCAD